MKSVTATEAELLALRTSDAKLAGLPECGVLVGNGPARLGRGPVDGNWWGWTRWRYDCDTTGGPLATTYPVDPSLEAALLDPKAATILTAKELTDARTLVAKAVIVAGQMPEGKP